MENKVFEKNLQKISSYDKNLALQISSINKPIDNIQITTTKKEEYNLIYKNFLIHNDNGAIEEAKNIVQKIDEKDNKNSIRIVYGLGLGYLADELSNHTQSKIIIYEPNKDLLNFVLSIAEIDAIYKQNVYVCSSKDKLKDYIFKFSNSETKITITFLSSYKNLYFDDIKSILDLIQKAQGDKTANKNTLISKSPSALEQTFKNLKFIIKNPLLDKLKDIYKGKTALVLSSGESLSENIEIIKENQDKFVIFAINSNFKMLIKNGIKPDFVVNIESNNISKQYDNTDTSSFYFINEAFCNNSIFNLKTKKTFNYISDINFLNPWLRKCFNIKNELKTLGTVSYSALMSAYLMGFDTIILCGQDLAYKNGACYSKGSHFDDLECVYDKENKKYIIKPKNFDAFLEKHLVNNNFEMAQKIAKEHLDFLNKNICTIKSQNNEDIPTQTGYALFIKYFCDSAKYLKNKKPNIKLLNASSGGAQIDGFENQNLKDIVLNLKKIEKLDLSNYEADFDNIEFQKEADKMLKGLDKFEDIINELISNTQKILKEFEIKKIITSNIEKTIKKIDELIRKINQKDLFDEINFISTMHSVIFFEALKNKDIKNYEILLNELQKAKNRAGFYKKTLKEL